MSSEKRPAPTRREAIGIIGALGLTTLVGCSSNGAGGAPESDAGTSGVPGDAGGPDTGASMDGGTGAGIDAGGKPADAGSGGAADGEAPACTLTPEQESGPYYASLEEIRSDIRSNTDGEGGTKPGAPLKLQIQIVDATTCAPVANAAVNIWHCDALGYYSGFEENDPNVPFGPGASTTYTPPDDFFRGVQITDASGKAAFTTIYPGWYAGRAIHIHVEVHVAGTAGTSAYSGGHVCHTGQLFFDETITEEVQLVAPYSSPRTLPDGGTPTRTTNATDSVYSGQGGASAMLTLTPLGSSASDGYTATVTLAVNPSATPAPVGGGGGGGHP